MYTNKEVYEIFRRCQGNASGRGYRLPKDWDSHYANKMSAENRQHLDTITAYFNTKWARINPETYFNIGFELFNMRFSYSKFLNKKILLHYINIDKLEKRAIKLTQDDIKSSVDFVNRFVNGDAVGSKLIRYCSMQDGILGLPVKHYIGNKITKAFMVFLMWYGYYTPSVDELNMMPYVREHYREVASNFTKETQKLCETIL